jgi:hypothetical protein
MLLFTLNHVYQGIVYIWSKESLLSVLLNGFRKMFRFLNHNHNNDPEFSIFPGEKEPCVPFLIQCPHLLHPPPRLWVTIDLPAVTID